MKRAISWCVRNSRAINIIVLAVVLLGIMSLWSLRRETFPQFALEIVLITVPYPGASPSEIEDGICRKIEESVHSLEGIKKVTSVAREGAGSVICELSSDVADPQKVLNEIKAEIDRIPSFPEFAEDPEIRQITLREPAIRVAVMGGSRTDERAEWDLREVTENIRNDLLQLPNVSNVDLSTRDYQIDIEIPEETLRKYNMSLGQIGEIIRQRNLEMPAGNIKTQNADFLVRGKNKQVTGANIEQLPVLTTREGTTLTVDDLGEVRDGFVDEVTTSIVNGKPALNLTVTKSPSEDVIQMCREVRDFVERKRKVMPEGYDLAVWADSSSIVEERLNMLGRNAVQGLIIVFITLSLFLELRLAFWVSMGIPISILGGCWIMGSFDQTLNMISLFAFLMVLGIVVDDAIVIGENIFKHRERGKTPIRAAIDGAAEVAPSVAASIITTIVCFAPMFFVAGVMGKFIAVMPLAIIAALVVSLLESTFALPCHLSHMRKDPPLAWLWKSLGFTWLGSKWEKVRKTVDGGLSRFINRRYGPFLRFSLRYPFLMYSFTAFFMLFTLGLVAGGYTPFIVFPKLDSDYLRVSLVYPTGTPGQITENATAQLEAAALRVNEDVKKQTGKDIIKFRYRVVGSAEDPMRPEQLRGSHVGQAFLELIPAQDRTMTSDEFLLRWREYAGEFPGLEEPPSFGTAAVGPQDPPIEFKLLSEDIDQLEQAIDETKQKLSTFAGVYDIRDDSRPGSWERVIQIKPEAQALGITEQEVFRTVRNVYYGEEVMRLQRGRNEVKLMVRYPKEDRRSLANFDEIRVRTPEGDEVPLPVVADITEQRGYAEINRVDQIRSVTITTDLDEQSANASEIVGTLKKEFMPELLQKYPGLRVRWEGQQQQTEESMESMKWGYIIALFINFVLLTIEFKSYTQSIIIFLCIPLGTAGAILGHLAWGLPLTMFSIFGLVALAGIVVNDAIVMIDWINRLRIEERLPLKEAIVQSGKDRFRPILLTSATTVGGLMPLAFEQSFQAQLLVPMAITICFGLLSATFWTLVLIPVMYQTWHDLTLRGRRDEDALSVIEEEEHEIEESLADDHEHAGDHRPHGLRRPAAVSPMLRRRISKHEGAAGEAR